MRWLEFSIETTHESSEVITDFLSSLGADGVQVQDAEEIKEVLMAPDSLTYADDDFMDNLDPVVKIKLISLNSMRA
jgi:ribosomal protein L11 methyltransferase